MLNVSRKTLHIACTLCLLWLIPTQSHAAPPAQTIPQPLLTGADLSGLPFQEEKGVKYYENG